MARIEEHLLADVRVKFCYTSSRKSVLVIPNERDLALAPLHSILRLWAIIEQWTAGLAKTHPGWKINGEPPDIRFMESTDGMSTEAGSGVANGCGRSAAAGGPDDGSCRWCGEQHAGGPEFCER